MNYSGLLKKYLVNFALLFTLCSCNGFPIRLSGELSLKDKEYESMALRGEDGKRRFMKNGLVKLEILGKRDVIIYTEKEQEGWGLKLGSASLSPLVKESKVLLDSKSTGQDYDILIEKKSFFQNKVQDKRLVECWSKTVKESRGPAGEKVLTPTMEKSYRRELVWVKKYREQYYVSFLHTNTDNLMAKFTSPGDIVEEVEWPKLIHCE